MKGYFGERIQSFFREDTGLFWREYTALFERVQGSFGESTGPFRREYRAFLKRIQVSFVSRLCGALFTG